MGFDAPRRANVPAETDKPIDKLNLTRDELKQLKQDVKGEMESKTSQELFEAFKARLTDATNTGIQRREKADGDHMKRDQYLALPQTEREKVAYYRAKEKGPKIFLHDTVDVLFLQATLRKMGFKGENGRALTIDGTWGDNTKGALTAFQQAAKTEGLYGKKVDGEFGPETFEALEKYIAKYPAGAPEAATRPAKKAAKKTRGAAAAPAGAPKEGDGDEIARKFLEEKQAEAVNKAVAALSPEAVATLETFTSNGDLDSHLFVSDKGKFMYRYDESKACAVTFKPNNIVEVTVSAAVDGTSYDLSFEADLNKPDQKSVGFINRKIDETLKSILDLARSDKESKARDAEHREAMALSMRKESLTKLADVDTLLNRAAALETSDTVKYVHTFITAIDNAVTNTKFPPIEVREGWRQALVDHVGKVQDLQDTISALSNDIVKLAGGLELELTAKTPLITKKADRDRLPGMIKNLRDAQKALKEMSDSLDPNIATMETLIRDVTATFPPGYKPNDVEAVPFVVTGVAPAAAPAAPAPARETPARQAEIRGGGREALKKLGFSDTFASKIEYSQSAATHLAYHADSGKIYDIISYDAEQVAFGVRTEKESISLEGGVTIFLSNLTHDQAGTEKEINDYFKSEERHLTRKIDWFIAMNKLPGMNGRITATNDWQGHALYAYKDKKIFIYPDGDQVMLRADPDIYHLRKDVPAATVSAQTLDAVLDDYYKNDPRAKYPVEIKSKISDLSNATGLPSEFVDRVVQMAGAPSGLGYRASDGNLYGIEGPDEWMRMKLHGTVRKGGKDVKFEVFNNSPAAYALQPDGESELDKDLKRRRAEVEGTPPPVDYVAADQFQEAEEQAAQNRLETDFTKDFDEGEKKTWETFKNNAALRAEFEFVPFVPGDGKDSPLRYKKIPAPSDVRAYVNPNNDSITLSLDFRHPDDPPTVGYSPAPINIAAEISSASVASLVEKLLHDANEMRERHLRPREPGPAPGETPTQREKKFVKSLNEDEKKTWDEMKAVPTFYGRLEVSDDNRLFILNDGQKFELFVGDNESMRIAATYRKPGGQPHESYTYLSMENDTSTPSSMSEQSILEIIYACLSKAKLLSEASHIAFGRSNPAQINEIESLPAGTKLEITTSNIESLLKSKKPAIIILTAPTWCPPCKNLEARLPGIMSRIGDRATVATLRSDKHPRTGEEKHDINPDYKDLKIGLRIDPGNGVPRILIKDKTGAITILNLGYYGPDTDQKILDAVERATET